MKTILLPADLFMALGLSAEAHSGIGSVVAFAGHDNPECVVGHACWLDGLDVLPALGAATPTEKKLWRASRYVTDPRARLTDRNDDRLIQAGFYERVSFEQWCRLVGVDVQT